MGNKTSDVLEILLSVSGLELDELYSELQGLCAPRGWCLTSLDSKQLREIMGEYLKSHLALMHTAQEETEDEWGSFQPQPEVIKA
ncbi:MAG TPA: hypothetical protein VM901_04490 [Bdellovibrionota bacterium]|nr:hypothetical protein [Bdellovibrionota bacterium]